eukprot:Rhum_TRINITY_DN163_c0_g1::Rhum_TRINITY_DN163_c0_g1_i1::g.501::m.501/K03462/NAMPT; nicotinamide phosphoribosyltransferase
MALTADDNIILMTDSYKISHFKQYPEGTESVYSYFESRGGKYPQTAFFGLQYLMMKHLEGVRVTKANIDEAELVTKSHFPPGTVFNRAGWEYIVEKHGGRLPIVIKAVPEGTVVDTKNVLMTIENTDPKCYWLTNYIETLLVQIWYPTTVATHSRACKKVILDALRKSGDPELVQFKLQDFGFRGVSSVETAGIGGAAHLVNFMGTDTVAGIVMANRVYGASIDAASGACPGYSIPASEHSTITAWGRESEGDAMENMLDVYPNGLVACVSDSYDVFHACEKIWGERLKEKIVTRDGCLVVRPDSGDPCETSLKLLEILGDKFGYTTNEKGYKVLDPHVRMIWGDGIDYESLKVITDRVMEEGWSIDNIGFGSGGGLLQKLHRDTQKCAFKCSYAVVNGKGVDVFKDPITDPGKVSKKGKLSLERDENGGWVTRQHATDFSKDNLVEVFRDGVILQKTTFEEVRARAREGL